MEKTQWLLHQELLWKQRWDTPICGHSSILDNSACLHLKFRFMNQCELIVFSEDDLYLLINLFRVKPDTIIRLLDRLFEEFGFLVFCLLGLCGEYTV